MSDSFERYQRAIDQVAKRFPGSPRQEVVVTRLLFHVAKVLEEDIDKVLERHGLTGATWGALMIIYGSADNLINPCDLSHLIGSSRTSMTRFADDLVDKDWVTRRVATDDRRRIDLSLTRAGQALVERVLPLMRAHYQALWRGFSKTEMQALEGALHELLQRMEQ